MFSLLLQMYSYYVLPLLLLRVWQRDIFYVRTRFPAS